MSNTRLCSITVELASNAQMPASNWTPGLPPRLLQQTMLPLSCAAAVPVATIPSPLARATAFPAITTPVVAE